MFSNPSTKLIVAYALGAIGFSSVPMTWPAFSAWQPQVVTQVPADGSGQTFIPEFDHPLRIDLPVNFAPSRDVDTPRVVADVTVLSSPERSYEHLSVAYDPAGPYLRVPLAGIRVEAGTPMRLRLQDPDGMTWVGGTDFDSYSGGELLRSGQPVEGDMAFRLVYRRKLFDLVRQGISVGMDSWSLVLAAFSAVTAAGLLTSGLLRRLCQLDRAGWVSFGIGAGLLVTAMFGFAAALLRVQLSSGWMIPWTLVVATIGVVLWRGVDPPSRADGKSLGLFVLVLLLIASLRMALAASLPLPPHSDSIENYAIVADMLAPRQAPIAVNQISDLLERYYHYGYHALAAWLAVLGGGFTPKAVLVLGQLLQAAVVGVVYFPVYAAVRDRRAALTAVLFAGLGWIMPAYASNWAKLPALAGLAVLPVVIGLLALAARSRVASRERFLLAAGCAALAAVVVHTRVAFLLAAFLLAYWIAKAMHARSLVSRLALRALGSAGMFLMSAALILLAPTEARAAAWGAVTKFVAGHGRVTSLLILLMTPFALRRSPVPSLTCILWAFFIVLFQFLPPYASYPFPLIDATMASMALFLPWTALGGMAVVGLVDDLQEGVPLPAVKKPALVIFAVIGLGWMGWAFSSQKLAADECCLIAGRDDAAVIDHIAVLPAQARILIPGDAPPDYSLVPLDGGAWVYPLTGRTSVPWRFDVDFPSSELHDVLCEKDLTHIYVGMRERSFRREALDLAPSFYSPIVVNPRAALYSLIGCGLK